MEWCIPIETFTLDNVQLGSTSPRGAKPLIPLAYRDPEFTFPALSLILPELPVKSYDPATGRLVLSLADHTYTQTQSKLQTLQDMLLSAVNSQHTSWYAGPSRKPQEIRAGFQPMVVPGELHLYCPIYESMSQPIPIWSGGAWLTTKPRPGLLTGRVRIAFRIHGLSFHLIPGTAQWSGKFRLQHKIIAAWIGPQH